ncbi:hypothetical protein CERZMDRAFT_88530 [Cercospora zeae-maydis SCOH1-5]|uniref:Uncharacterized protein n=1 Tax=Cercospora zeae-maydis SCOH1-5 TaxID=717836 RepID=A0A6A6F0L6_9PEZI|nr:hypothetical protein CERZMDRAFT_88530 [Cercospora zeae-maydis SCOH1-5]
MLSLHQLAAVLLLAPTFTLANPSPHERALAGFAFNELFARWDCSGSLCGSDSQYCCTAGTSCTTDAANIAGCASAPVTQAPVGSGGGGGAWQYYTTTWVETGLVTRTSVWSSYIGGAAATGIACNYALNESPCGSICCASDQYCFSKEQSQCASNGNSGSSGAGAATYVAPGATAGAPIRPTSSGQLTVTATRGPTTTVPFMEPVATGANVTITGMEEGGGGGLSGGAIAGIVIGVLAGLALLALLCFCCCIKGLLDGCLACFGLGGRKKKRRTEIDEYERYSHHSGGGGGGRTWYGAARPPARVDRRDERKSSSGKNLLGLGAGLAALWAVLGLKRQHDKKNSEKYSEYSYSSDYYTSASSASSDDRRTRGTRYSRR